MWHVHLGWCTGVKRGSLFSIDLIFSWDLGGYFLEWKYKDFVMFQCMACACIRIWGDPGDQFLSSPWLVLSVCLEFLGGLSLHLNHLIQSHMEISHRLFGTLPIGLLLTNLDSRQLETSMTSYDQFWNMSTFGDSRAVRVICQKKMPSENQFFSMKEQQGFDEARGGFRWAGP